MTTADATRLAGEAYSTRLAREVAAKSDDKTRLVHEGYQSMLACDAADVQPDTLANLADLTAEEYLAMLDREAASLETETNEYFEVGEMIGERYEVSAVHHGAMGVVYGCFDHKTKLPRALKTVSAQYFKDKQVLELFESEALVWISLEKHPNIVRAYLVTRFGQMPYVITEYVRGPDGMEGDLRGWLGHPRLTLSVAVSMALQIAQGMQHAVHKVPNLVHRDLKPANILVNGDGKPMVTDFGLVHAAESGAGTPAYMSPEQWRGQELDMRSDIYAYGCILFEMFTSHRLFPALAECDWERAHLEGLPVSLTSLVPELTEEIDQFVRRCLEKNPAARPQSWDEVVTFFAEWYHRMTGKAVVLDFSTLVLDIDELFAAGYSLQNIYRFEDAIRVYERVLAIDPNSAYAWSNIGNALNGLNRHKDAISAYDRALAISPNDQSILDGRLIALINLEQEEKWAKPTPEMELSEVARGWFTVGNRLRHLERYEEAVRVFDRSLAYYTKLAGPWICKGQCLNDLMRYEEAIQAFNQGLAINHESAFAWTNKGSALYHLERNEEAIQAVDHALAIDPKNADAWTYKGLALDDLNRHEEAIDAYNQALLIAPSSEAVWLWIYKGLALFNLNQYGDAMDAYDRALLIDPTCELALRGRQEVVNVLGTAG